MLLLCGGRQSKSNKMGAKGAGAGTERETVINDAKGGGDTVGSAREMPQVLPRERECPTDRRHYGLSCELRYGKVPTT